MYHQQQQKKTYILMVFCNSYYLITLKEVQFFLDKLHKLCFYFDSQNVLLKVILFLLYTLYLKHIDTKYCFMLEVSNFLIYSKYWTGFILIIFSLVNYVYVVEAIITLESTALIAKQFRTIYVIKILYL